ncbi:MAG: redox-sensing transcriptional repressor Rex [Bacillota bacterium]|jgi:redox-sensing transcriptional repressor|nr:redox-sensing transcriptional repressor Rex [Bacillota bacterium]
MKDFSFVSNTVIKRLPRYRRILGDLSDKGVKVVSSTELSRIAGYTASQIRQDLNNFGAFGQQGYGYNVERLYRQIGMILGLQNEYKMIVLGAGNLGQAIANYTRFYKSGYHIIAMFDVNPKLVGLRINDIEVLDAADLPAFLENNQVDIAVVTTDKDSAQSVTDVLVGSCIRGVWNFTAAELDVPEDMVVENVHLSDSLHMLTYYLNQNSLKNKEQLSS